MKRTYTQIGERIYIGEIDAIRVIHLRAQERQLGAFYRFGLPAIGFAAVCALSLIVGI